MITSITRVRKGLCIILKSFILDIFFALDCGYYGFCLSVFIFRLSPGKRSAIVTSTVYKEGNYTEHISIQ
jgi:hypothetical protein